MLQKLLTSLLFFLLLFCVTAQSDSIRYISYPNNSENSDLYDPNLPYGLHAAIRGVSTEIKRQYKDKLTGISTENWELLREFYGTAWCRIPGLEFKIKWQEPMPLANQYGEDSLDNMYEYVYPPADTIWFMTERYDELIVKEMLRYDSLSQSKQYMPAELILLKNFPAFSKPIVTAVIPYEWLYTFPLTILEQWPKQKSDSLIPALEEFLTGAEQEFAPEGFYAKQNSWQMCQEHDPRLLNMATKHEKHLICNEYLKTYEDFIEDLRHIPDIYWHIDSTVLPLMNRYGEDSAYYENGKWTWAMNTTYDSCFYVKSGFENAYYNTVFAYDQPTASWIRQTQYFLLTKTLLPGELPVITYKKLVYAYIDPKRISNEHYPPDSEEFILEKKRLQYEMSYNPLNHYKHPESATHFNWEKDLQQHACNWKLTTNPIR